MGLGRLLIIGLVGTQYKAHRFVLLFGELMTYTPAELDLMFRNFGAGPQELVGIRDLYVTPWKTHSGYAVSFGFLVVILFVFHMPMLVLQRWRKK